MCLQVNMANLGKSLLARFENYSLVLIILSMFTFIFSSLLIFFQTKKEQMH